MPDKLQDDGFWKILKNLKGLGDNSMLNMREAARKGAPPFPINQDLSQRVADRALLGETSNIMPLTGDALSAKGFAPQRSPPIENGITHCVDSVYNAVTLDYENGRADFKSITMLLKRIKYLIRVFYNFKITKKIVPDLHFCDFKKIFDISIKLHKVGLFLQLDFPRLRAFMSAGGDELEKFILDDQLDIGPYRKEAARISKLVSGDNEADDNDREGVSEISDLAEEDYAAHVLAWFFADLHVAFLLNDSRKQNETRWANKALCRIVKWSTSTTWRNVLGDPLTDSMRPIYWSKPALIKLAGAGGLSALYGDWVNSVCVDLCEEILQTLPDKCWENQPKSALRAVTRELQSKEEHEGRDIVTSPIFISAFSNIFARYGLAPFKTAAKYETFQTSVLFHFLSHRINTDGLEMKTRREWRALLEEYVHLPTPVERRYSWLSLNISGKWDCLEYYGCSHDTCPEKRLLIEAREKRVRGTRDQVLEDRLHSWGAKSLSCAGCKQVSYCGTSCQKKHWEKHRVECKRSRAFVR